MNRVSHLHTLIAESALKTIRAQKASPRAVLEWAADQLADPSPEDRKLLEEFGWFKHRKGGRPPGAAHSPAKPPTMLRKPLTRIMR